MDASRRPVAAAAPAELDAEIDLDAPPVAVDLHDGDQRRRVERQLTSIPGVLAARVVPGYDRDVDELHIVTSPDRGPKATVRDVQTVLLARCGVDIDHRVVSVVRLDERQVLPAPARVQLEEVGTIQAGRGLVAEVTLSLDGDRARATADGASTGSGHARAVARATLTAFTELIDSDLVIELRDCRLTNLGGEQLAVTLLELRSPRSEELRSGSALVGEPASDAIARSVLDAVNRTLGTT